MKIAYILNYAVNNYDGVISKIKSQTHEWEKNGHIVQKYCLFSDELNPVIQVYQYKENSKIKKKLYLQKDLIIDIKSFNPDLIYFRYTYWNRTLSYLQKNYKNIVEINTLDIAEYWLNLKIMPSIKNAFIFLFNLLSRSLVLKKVTGIISVTNQIAQHKSLTKYNKKICICSNPYNLDHILYRKKTASVQRKGLFFIGSPNQEWHGIDIIEKLAEKLPQYDFHIVGIEKTNRSNVFYYGYLKKERYFSILDKCQICIGTLAAFRKGLTECSPLKVREYLSYGYPIIIGYNDTAFINLETMPEWVLQINTKIPLDLPIIIRFIENNADKTISVDQIENIISAEVIEKKRIDFFKGIVNK